MPNKKNPFKKLLPEYGELLKTVMSQQKLTVEKLSIDAHCSPSCISALRARKDWRASEIIQMSKLTKHNFVLYLLPEPLEDMVPAAALKEALSEMAELKKQAQQDHDTILKLQVENEIMKKLLDKK